MSGNFVSRSDIVATGEIVRVLRTVMALPVSIVSLKLTLAVDQVPTIECTSFPTNAPEVDVTHFESKARTFARDPRPVTKRYALVELP